MTRSLILFLALALGCLCGCAPGQNSPDKDAPGPKPRDPLGYFEAGALARDIEAPDFAEYWRLAANNNGNALPVRTTYKEAQIVVRLNDKGRLSLLRGDKFEESTSQALAGVIQSIGLENWNAGQGTSHAVLIALVDRRAPLRLFLELQRMALHGRVANFCLLTRDSRLDKHRLFPLFIGLDRGPESNIPLDSRTAKTAACLIVQSPDNAVTLNALSGAWKLNARGKWGDELESQIKTRKSEIIRLLLDLDPSLTVAAFQDAVNEIAGIGILRIECAIEALDRAGPQEPSARLLVQFADDLGVLKRVTPPTASEYWRRASAAHSRLAASVKPAADKPLLVVALEAGGGVSWRARNDGQWTSGNEDGLRRALGIVAEKHLDLSSLTSGLQVVIVADPAVHWERILAVREMQAQARAPWSCLLLMDVLGPTPRLLDISLALGDSTTETSGPVLTIRRAEGADAAGYSVQLTSASGVKLYTAEGPAWLANLSRALSTGDQPPADVLHFRLPGDEPIKTFVEVLDAAVALNPKRLSLVP